MESILRIAPEDNVAVALRPLEMGEEAGGLLLRERIPMGHKVALRPIAKGENVVKYGYPIGRAAADIAPGEWVHVHNAVTRLSGEASFQYTPRLRPLPEAEPASFMGFRRGEGRVGIRNELWIIPTVGCVGSVTQALARENAGLARDGIDGVYAFVHPYGCSQMGEDHARTRRLLAALCRHPNAGGVLVLSLGCENLTKEEFLRELDGADRERIRFLTCQEEADELSEGGRLLRELAETARRDRRESVPASELVVGLKCGGSDGLSGITANPAVGAMSDLLLAQGGSALLTEIPEVFGAEEALLCRCRDRDVFERAAGMIEGFRDYFVRHGQAVYENPSPGNKAGGITTLEDKSLGCVQKGGTAPVEDAAGYGERVRRRGLTLLCAPGNDLVSSTALAAAGAHLILFTTGRGTPFGAPVPTLKIATNTPLFQKKQNWMDFDAGPIARGEPVAQAARRLLALVLDTAGGQRTRAEQNGYREIAVWKDGVTL